VNSDKDMSIENASVKALAILEPLYYQIVIKRQKNLPPLSAYEILFNLQTVLEKETKSGDLFSQDSTVNPIAVKIMRMMGWSPGCGLGVKEQGMKEPIV